MGSARGWVETHRRPVTVRAVPPAGALRLRDGGGAVRECRHIVASVRMLPSRPPSTQAAPSRRGPWRSGRSFNGALHLDARNHARSTVCGPTADGMGARESGGSGGTQGACLLGLRNRGCLPWPTSAVRGTGIADRRATTRGALPGLRAAGRGESAPRRPRARAGAVTP
jgi:hypothetical protein